MKIEFHKKKKLADHLLSNKEDSTYAGHVIAQ